MPKALWTSFQIAAVVLCLAACSKDDAGSAAQGNGSSTQPVPSDQAPKATPSKAPSGSSAAPKLPAAPKTMTQGCDNAFGSTCQNECCQGGVEYPDGAYGCPNWLAAKPDRCEVGVNPRMP